MPIIARRLLNAAALAAACAAALTAVTGAQAQTKWDLPTPYPDTNFHTKNIKQFAEEVSAASGGKLTITVHSNGSLIKHPDIKRAVQTGQVPIGEILISVQANESPLYAFDSNPFLAASYDESKKLWAAAKAPLTKRLDGQGIALLYSVAWPPQGIYTKKPIESIADLKGTKFRTYSPTTSRFAELMGAVPTTVQVPEIPQAFRTGLVDAMITSGSTGVDTQAWDYLTHYYDVQAFLPQNMVIVSKDALAKLDAATQKLVLDAAARAETRGWAASIAENDRVVKIMAEKGIKVLAPSAKLKAELAGIGKQIADEWVKRAGAEGEAIVAGYRK
jgi:TRAP-type C4-dicarboxylate transport system substrate-binding protein